MRNCGSGLSPKNNFGAGTRGQFPMTADKVSVQMRFDHILDLQTIGGGFRQVLIDIALGIDYYRLAIRTDQVGSMSQTVEIELLEIHFKNGEIERSCLVAARILSQILW